MLSLSPSSLSALQGWPLEATMGHDPDLREDSFAGYSGFGMTGTPLQESFVVFPGQAQLHDRREPNSSTPTSEESSTVKRKLCHNAYERDRRKKINTLYSSLRSLLPETEHHKKLSIPSTVSWVLQYIPELQRQIERLERRKEDIMARLSREEEDNLRPGGNGGLGVYPVISIAEVGDGEIAMQICSSCGRRGRVLSEVLEYLEGEGLGVVSASFLAMDESRPMYSLRLQVKDLSLNVEPRTLSKDLACILS